MGFIEAGSGYTNNLDFNWLEGYVLDYLLLLESFGRQSLGYLGGLAHLDGGLHALIELCVFHINYY